MTSPYLIQRGNSYSVRVRLPVSVSRLTGRTHFTRALGLTCAIKAKVAALSLASDILAAAHKIGEMMHGVENVSLLDIDSLSDEEFLGLANTEGVFKILSDGQQKAVVRRLNEHNLRAENEVLKLDITRLNTEKAGLHLKSLISGMKRSDAELAAAKSLHDGKLHELQAVEAEKRATDAETVKVNVTDLLAALGNGDGLVRTPAKPKYPVGGELPVKPHIETFMKEREKAGFARTTRLSFEKALATLSDVLGQTPIYDVTRQDVAKILNKLEGQAGKNGRADLKRATVQKYLSHAKTFFAWAESRGLVNNNPAEKVMAPQESRKAAQTVDRLPYSNEQLRRMFNAPLFQGCNSERAVFAPGDVLVRDGRFWVPIVGLFTGLRLGEIEQLRPQDIKKHEGYWCIDVNTDDGKEVKTAESIRLVPIHPTLQAAGFLEYVSQRKKQFPKLSLFDKRNYSKFWNEQFLRRTGLKTEKLVFHSFRHTFSAWVRAIPNNETKNRLMGHAPDAMGEHYGRILTGQEIELFNNLPPVFDLTTIPK